MPVMPKLPGVDEWKLSSVLHACGKLLTAEERQPTEVWTALQSQKVPHKLREFVVAALWRKLLVTQRQQTFGVLMSLAGKNTFFEREHGFPSPHKGGTYPCY